MVCIYKNASASGGTPSPSPLPGLCPWTPLGDCVPQTPWLIFAVPPQYFPKVYAYVYSIRPYHTPLPLHPFTRLVLFMISVYDQSNCMSNTSRHSVTLRKRQFSEKYCVLRHCAVSLNTGKIATSAEFNDSLKEAVISYITFCWISYLTFVENRHRRTVLVRVAVQLYEFVN